MISAALIKAAQIAGTFVGYTIGSAIKVAGPQIEELLANAIKRAFKDTAEVSKPNPALQQYGDALGLFRKDEAYRPAARNGDDATGADKAREGLGAG